MYSGALDRLFLCSQGSRKRTLLSRAGALLVASMNVLKRWLVAHSSVLVRSRGTPDEVKFFAPSSGKSCVRINSKQKSSAQVIALLHECGHIIVYNRRRRRPHKRHCGATFREWWCDTGRCSRGSKKRKLAILHEEIEAWELGEKLAKKLGVRYSPRELELTRTHALLTYTRDCLL